MPRVFVVEEGRATRYHGKQAVLIASISRLSASSPADILSFLHNPNGKTFLLLMPTA